MLGIFDKKEKKVKKSTKKTDVSVSEKSSKDSAVDFGSNLVLGVHTSEKAVRLANGSNQYTFRIHPSANKNEVRKQVEKMFNVEVVKVRITNLPNKNVFYKGRPGVKSGVKKAIVSLKPGDAINSMTS